ncbi:hypothetical protein LRR81_19690 [Metabacillus sp. GX 13764]|uniref:hypothetical protein n=1 Tax=Metabacillus kandeliae TaxID=2900151 RepID=UPI001E476314|nr:hypothetical protein [Metabacillus kandeliae]MCD7036475.1 hypothetical protein [Metabacillus kandeliae]
MKKLLLIFTFLTLFSAGCSNSGQRIEVSCSGFKVNIQDQEKVTKINEILGKVNWQQSKADMSRQPDCTAAFKDGGNADEKAVQYKIWISGKKDQLEIIKGYANYAKLSKESSAKLYKIIRGT